MAARYDLAKRSLRAFRRLIGFDLARGFKEPFVFLAVARFRGVGYWFARHPAIISDFS